VSAKKQLILLRHGKTDYPNRYVGSRDVPLSPHGISQIRALKNTFRNKKVDRIIASPMLRCRQSCELLFDDCNIVYNEDLREIDFGLWEGMTFQEIAENDPALVEQWATWSLDFCFPEGESIRHFVNRVQKAGKFLARLKEETVVTVCHGGVVRALLCYYLGLDPENYLLFQVAKGTFSTLDLYGDRGVLTGLNLG
jgi:alpha-ribazole phosphatase